MVTDAPGMIAKFKVNKGDRYHQYGKGSPSSRLVYAGGFCQKLDYQSFTRIELMVLECLDIIQEVNFYIQLKCMGFSNLLKTTAWNRGRLHSSSVRLVGNQTAVPTGYILKVSLALSGIVRIQILKKQ